MKRYINYFLFVVMGSFFLTACNEDNEYDGNELLVLKLSSTNIELDPHQPDSEVLTISWTNGVDDGHSGIEYLLQIDRQGNQFDGGLSIELGQRIHIQKYTHVQLNDILLGDFNASPNETVTLEARVVALKASENTSDQISEIIPFSITTCLPIATELYITGSATGGETTNMNAEGVGEFEITTNLVQGDFKFVTTVDNPLPSYNRDAGSAEFKLVYRQKDDEPDEKFAVEVSGRYHITVNIINLTITIEKQELVPLYDKMYFVGDFNGWNFVEMTKDPFNPYVFRFGGIFNDNGNRAFKFGTTPDSWSNMLHPTIARAPITHTEAMFDDTGDNLWILAPEQNNKAYKIVIDIAEGQESMMMSEYVPYTSIFIIGNASPIGWSLEDRAQTQMTKGVDDYTYTWTGPLSVGEIKFKCSDDISWASDDAHPWYMAMEFGVIITPNTDMIITSNQQGPSGRDSKWIVEEAGNYVVTINQLTETVRFDKQ